MQFEWSLPTRVVFGVGRFQVLQKYIRGFGKRVLIVTSRSFLKGGAREHVLNALLEQLQALDVESRVFGEIEPNPRTSTVDRGAALAREFRPRYILALGGGSVMDSAKCIALLAKNEGEVYEYAYRGPGREMRPFNHALPIVCIPTVAATSSETDFYAVVTHEQDQRKVTVFGDTLRPALSIIDPELTYTVPPAQTVDGAFDIITHVTETYLSTPTPAPLQDRLTEAVVETVVSSLRRVLENPKDELGRSQLSWCAAFALSGTFSGRDGGWPVHALEHGLSAYTDVAHGRGLALLLPRVMAYDEQVIGEKLEHFNQRIFGTPKLNDGLVSYMKEVGAWTNLDEIANGLSVDELIHKTIAHALEIKGVWKRGEEPYLENCRSLYAEDLERILRS